MRAHNKGAVTVAAMLRRRLAGISLAQLAFGAAGMTIAVRRGHAYDVPLLRGSPETVARDSLLLGTALSAPATMLAAQAACTAAVARSDNQRAARGLALLGAAMTGGYLAERHVRARLSRHGWDALETPVIVGGLGLAAAMAGVGRACWHEQGR